jgi:CheY-like chemotaxis protein
MNADASLPEPAAPRRLLLCDDSPVERMALAHLLRRAGYSVDEAGDGKSALLHLQHRQVDLLVLDLHMPGLDGFDVLKYVQVHRRSLPVVLLSGMPLDEIQQGMGHLPAQELPPLLLKPIDVHQLLELCEMLLTEGMPELREAADEP